MMLSWGVAPGGAQAGQGDGSSWLSHPQKSRGTSSAWTGSYWEELEHGGCSYWAAPSCPDPCPVITRLRPARSPASPLPRVISCISDRRCRPLIRRNLSGKGCNEAPAWLSRDRDDRGNFHAGSRGWIWVWAVISFILPFHLF